MRKLAMSLSLTLAIAVGLWFGFGVGMTAPSKPAIRPANANAAVDRAAQPKLLVVAPADLTGVQGDSTSTSTESEGSAGSGEGESESIAEPAGEPIPGHEDPQGVDVNHDCSAENPSGCDTANGELP